MKAVRLPRAIFRWRFEKEGFRAVEIAASSPDDVLSVALAKEDATRAGMVHVPEGPFMVPLNGFAPSDPVTVGPFWIDGNEVTNAQYKEFVESGGYENGDFWKHDVVKDGRVLSWEEAQEELRDTTRTSRTVDVGAGRLPGGAGRVSRRRRELVRGGSLRRVSGEATPDALSLVESGSGAPGGPSGRSALPSCR